MTGIETERYLSALVDIDEAMTALERILPDDDDAYRAMDAESGHWWTLANTAIDRAHSHLRTAILFMEDVKRSREAA